VDARRRVIVMMCVAQPGAETALVVVAVALGE
jgi:hypothetical protein